MCQNSKYSAHCTWQIKFIIELHISNHKFTVDVIIRRKNVCLKHDHHGDKLNNLDIYKYLKELFLHCAKKESYYVSNLMKYHTLYRGLFNWARLCTVENIQILDMNTTLYYIKIIVFMKLFVEIKWICEFNKYCMCMTKALLSLCCRSIVIGQ